MSIITQQANNPVPFDQQVKPERGQSFPGRTKQFWHFDPDYDQQHDREIHVTYTYYTFLVVGYGFDTRYFNTGGSNSTGPGALLSAGQSFTSLSIRTVLHDSNEAERQGIGVRKTMAALAPQQLENPLIYMVRCRWVDSYALTYCIIGARPARCRSRIFLAIPRPRRPCVKLSPKLRPPATNS